MLFITILFLDLDEIKFMHEGDPPVEERDGRSEKGDERIAKIQQKVSIQKNCNW